ncbi:MAG: efflux RND transporter periplasmic adaptor subunit [Candidatus Latescibacteria bacterium]|nr:efflux RND transporter periplasmic adaptor subunit [Candidatus Latescibacterota bacterium]
MHPRTRVRVALALCTVVVIAGVSLIVTQYGDRIPGLKSLPMFRPAAGVVTARPDEADYWTCTMHPSVRMKEPGKCPICGMDLVPVRAQGMPDMPGMKGMTPATTQPAQVGNAPDRSVFTVDPARQQLIGVQIDTVQIRTLEKTIRTVGLVEPDERRTAQIYTKVDGWIDKVFVNYTWQHVMKGAPLFSLYSPDLVSTQEEYLTALKSMERLGESPFPDVAARARSLLDATRKRLLFFDITPQQIDELERTKQMKKELIIYSPITGHVTERNAFPGMRVEPNTRLYTVIDHSYIWVKVDIYEQDIPFVHVGQRARMTVDAYPGRTFAGTLTFIEPHMMSETRTLKVRLEFPNPDLVLKPEMYANIDLTVSVGPRLAVPTSAVLRTGQRDLVFVNRGEGRMEMRKVEVGTRTGDYYEVLGGLRAGERIVTAANFLIDAESKVQGAQATWETPNVQHKEHVP